MIKAEAKDNGKVRTLIRADADAEAAQKMEAKNE